MWLVGGVFVSFGVAEWYAIGGGGSRLGKGLIDC